MDKKIILAIIIVVAVAVVIFVINPFKPPATTTPAGEEPVDENLYSPLDYLTPEELATHDTQLQESDVVRYNALQQNNIGVCEQEKNSADIGWCKAAVAEKLKDESVCPSLDDSPQNQCYYDVAIATGKTELCRNIKETDWSNECLAKLASINNNLDTCKAITDSGWADTCFGQLAMNRNDTGLCEQIKDADFRFDCKQNITG